MFNIFNYSIYPANCIFYFLFFSCITSCGLRGNDVDIQSKGGYFLEKVDSIKIVYENEIKILDFDQDSRKLLAVDKISKDFLLLNEAGELLESVNRYGEGPDEYNSSIMAASFLPDNEGFLLLSSRDLIWYDAGWKVKSRQDFFADIQIISYVGPGYKVPYYLAENGKDLSVFVNFFSGFNAYGNDAYGNEDFLLQQFSPLTSELDWVFTFNQDLLPTYRLEDKKTAAKPVQVYAIDRDKHVVYLTFQSSDEIGVYDLWNDFELIEKIAFSHKDFQVANGAKNKALLDFQSEVFGILYYKGLSESAILMKKNSDPEYIPVTDPSLYSFIVVDKENHFDEIPFPDFCEPLSELVQLSGNRILMRDKYLGDDEPEYYTYSIFELKSK